MLFIISVTYYEYHKLMNKALYIFIPLSLIITIILEAMNQNGIIYKSFIGAGVLGLLSYILTFINPNNRKFLLLSITIGFMINIEGVLLFLLIFGLVYLIKLLIKKLPPLYIVSLATMMSFVFGSKLIEFLINLLK